MHSPHWYIRGISSLTAGFISDYASKSPEEDFAELYGTYMVLLPEEWENLMVQADYKYKPDSRYTGREILERKLAIMKEYLKANYHLDIDVVRAEANRRICAMADYRKLPTRRPTMSLSRVTSRSFLPLIILLSLKIRLL